MVCKKCGMEIVSGQVYCPFCGEELLVTDDLEEEYLKSVLTETDKKETLAELSEQNQTDEGAQKGKQQTAEAEHRKPDNRRKPNRKKRRGILVAVVLILVCAAAVGYWYYYRTTHSAEYLLSHAQTAYEGHHYEEASEYLGSFLAMDPQNGEALLLQAKLYTDQKEYRRAEELCNHLLQRDPQNLEIWKTLLDVYDREGDYDKILSRCEDTSDAAVQELFQAYLVPMPQVNISGGSYSEPQELLLNANDHRLKVYYTLDGSVPDKKSDAYDLKRRDPIPINEEGETILRAVCYDDNGHRSRILTETYHLDFDRPSAPLISPDGGEFNAPVSIAITAGSGCTIYYNWDGGTPTTDSKVYRGTLQLPEGNHVLSAIAVNEYGKSSEVTKTNFIFYP